MALFLKNILVRSTSSATEEVIRSFTENWLSGFDNDSSDEFFAFIIDRKHEKTLIAFSPKARSVYGILDDDNFIPIVDIPENIANSVDKPYTPTEQDFQDIANKISLPDFDSIIQEKVDKIEPKSPTETQINQSVNDNVTDQRLVDLILPLLPSFSDEDKFSEDKFKEFFFKYAAELGLGNTIELDSFEINGILFTRYVKYEGAGWAVTQQFENQGQLQLELATNDNNPIYIELPNKNEVEFLDYAPI